MKVELSNPIFFFRNLVWLNNKIVQKKRWMNDLDRSEKKEKTNENLIFPKKLKKPIDFKNYLIERTILINDGLNEKTTIIQMENERYS